MMTIDRERDNDFSWTWIALLWASLAWLSAHGPALGGEPQVGDATLQATIHGHPLIITTRARVAGAIDSLQWNGKEFVDSWDHGRQIQSAASFDNGRNDTFWPERFNPTEAGSRADGTGDRSTSSLIQFAVEDGILTSHSRLAFWLAPGEDSFGHPAINQTRLSAHELRKQIRIGAAASEDLLQFDVCFRMPPNEPHRLAQFEVLTGYMPSEFSQFWRWNPEQIALTELDVGPGEQPYPVAFSTPDKNHAMGVWMETPKRDLYSPKGYGRFRFQTEDVVKWNAVVRHRSTTQIEERDHAFRVYVALGTLDDVRADFKRLHEHERAVNAQRTRDKE